MRSCRCRDAAPPAHVLVLRPWVVPVTADCVRTCREEPTTKARTATTRCSTRRKTPTPPGGTCPKVRVAVRTLRTRGSEFVASSAPIPAGLALHAGPVPPSIVVCSLTLPVLRLRHACRLAPPALVARVPGRCRLVKRSGDQQCHTVLFSLTVSAASCLSLSSVATRVSGMFCNANSSSCIPPKTRVWWMHLLILFSDGL